MRKLVVASLVLSTLASPLAIASGGDSQLQSSIHATQAERDAEVRGLQVAITETEDRLRALKRELRRTGYSGAVVVRRATMLGAMAAAGIIMAGVLKFRSNNPAASRAGFQTIALGTVGMIVNRQFQESANQEYRLTYDEASDLRILIGLAEDELRELKNLLELVQN